MFATSVQAHPFDLAVETARLSALGPAVGAVVTFTGQVRAEPLFLDHYPAMAQRQLDALLVEARSRWPILGAIVIHRFGALAVGEPIVLVATASAHRADAFDSAVFLMDWLKTRAPFWKRGADGWVDARTSDDEAAKRWKE